MEKQKISNNEAQRQKEWDELSGVKETYGIS